MEEKLKDILRKYYDEYMKLPKPQAYKAGGTYYGSTELFSAIGNRLEMIENCKHTSYGYAGCNTYYKNCCVLLIGGAYKISTKELYEELVAIAGGVYVKDTNLGIINDYGTNFSVIGFGYITR